RLPTRHLRQHAFPPRRSPDLLRAALVAALLAQDRVGVGALRPPRLLGPRGGRADARGLETRPCAAAPGPRGGGPQTAARARGARSEEHTSELQSRENLVCRPL